MSGKDTYDYIIVGGGSSGCVTANRLVSEYGARVLLLEAGGSNKSFMIRWPAMVFNLITGNKFVKHYMSEPQQHLGGRQIEITQGKVLGGGSSVNVNAYLRGSRGDYDRWTKATGFPWGWDELVPIFKRQEGNKRFDNDAHGGDGPLKVSDPIASPPSTDIFLKTMQRLGLPYREDFGAGELTGVGYLQTTMHKSKRCSSADAFLSPIMDDPRLTLVLNAEVQKIRFDGLRAAGIEYIHRGERRYAEASSEIILAAGPLVTPKLLMLSGIGPGEQLRSHGITPLVDSPGVGENFHDHPILPMTLTTKGAFGMFGADKGFQALSNAVQYLAFGQGPLAFNGSDAIAFTNLDDPSDEPNVQIYCGPIMFPGYTGDGPDTHGVTLMANFVRPRSRGRVWLRSANPKDDLAIDLNWLSDPEDARLMLKGFKYLRRIAAAEPFASMVGEERLPGPKVQTDEQLMESIRQLLRTNYHPCGTCKMGADNDPMAVLTPDLRVRGVEGLRVFDVSSIPEIISSATNATAMAVAERGVELMMKRSQEGLPAGAA